VKKFFFQTSSPASEYFIQCREASNSFPVFFDPCLKSAPFQELFFTSLMLAGHFNFLSGYRSIPDIQKHINAMVASQPEWEIMLREPAIKLPETETEIYF